MRTKKGWKIETVINYSFSFPLLSTGFGKMPITTPFEVRNHTQHEFGKVAYEVVQHSFKMHAKLGRIFQESVFRSTLNQILGSRSVEEFEIRLTHKEFDKRIYIDLLVDHGCPFELKATESLADAHQCQLIQYLMLTGLTHGKLINFGMDCVDHRFVNCHETLEQRRKFQVERVDWLSSAYTDRLEHITVDLVQDWGTGLSRSLYKESLIALLGGEDQCRGFTHTKWKSAQTGRQSVYLIAPFISFEITCIRQDLDHYLSHLRRFLNNTDLESILWVNIVSGCLRFQKITKD
jgi:GxxExxY protein